MADSELERVFVTFLANDKDLEKAYRKIVERAKQVATEVGREFQQATGKGMSGMSSSVEQDANRMEKALADVYRAITALTDGLEKTRGRQRETTKTTDETREAFLKLRNETAALRNTVEAGATGTGHAITRFKELQKEALDASNAFGQSSNEYRQFTQVAAQASRSIATLEGRTTKLGFSANAAVGITHALRQHVDFLGKNAGIAGNGFAALGVAIGGFKPIGEGALGVLLGIRRGLTGLTVAIPLATAAITAGLTLALIRMGTAAAEAAEKIQVATHRTGLTAESYQEFAFAAEQAGVKTELLETTLQRLQRRAADAARGNKGLKEAFDELGVTLTDVQGQMLGTEELYNQVADGISGIQNNAERLRLAFKIFDTEGARLLPLLMEGSEGMARMREEARRLGLVISGDAVMSLVEFKQAWQTVQRQVATARTEIVAAFMPVITKGLIPLLQDTLVPALQNVATRANEMAAAFFDAGEEGRVFRDQIAVVGARVQAVGQFLYSLGQISLGLIQVLTAPFAALGTSIGNVSVGLEAMIDVYRRALQGDFSGFLKSPAQVMREAGVEMNAAIRSLTEQARLGLSNLGTGGALFFGAFDFNALEAQWRTTLDGVVAGTRDATRELSGLADVANDALTGIGNLADAAPEGSLAQLKEQLTAARRDFENAVTDEARLASIARIRLIEAEIAQIEALLTGVDVLEPARRWVGRLAAELEFGLKSADDVFALLQPRAEELRAEAEQALKDFGFDSQEFQTAVAKLNTIQGLLDRVSEKRTIPISLEIEPTAQNLARLTLGDALVAEVLERPTKEALFAIRAFTDEASAVMAEFRTDWSDFANGVALGAHQIETAATISSQAMLIFVDTLQAMRDAGAQTQELFDAISRNPAFSMTLMTGPGGEPPIPDAGLLQRALDEQRAAWEAAQAAMTEEALIAAGERYRVATEEVERLRSLYDGAQITAPNAAAQIAQIVDEELPRRLAAAAASAALFGTQTELAAASADILHAAIERILLLDPEADVTAQLEAWKAWRLEIGKGKGEATDLSDVLRDLEAAQERLAQLTGDAPTEWDNLRTAFQAAADAAVITREELERLLETIKELESAAAAADALEGWADAFDIAGQISSGLTGALEGIRAGDITGVLAGLTDIGAAIGTAIGGPAVGALIQQIGGFIQTLPSLFQAISDLFTGDSPARRDLARSLTQTVAGAVRAGVDAGLRGAEGWRDTLRSGIRESVVGALVDAFIEAAVTQAIIAPFIDEFTRILHRQGRDAALDFLEANLNSILSAAEVAAADIVRVFGRYFDDIQDPLRGGALNPGTFQLPDATVSVLAAPQWALELTAAAQVMNEAGQAMLEAAQLMRDTFQAGITVNNQSTRGIDAYRGAA